ncbi:hypothetical protein CY34DRAFT_17005 [Suillus luteus UH-Slu-Lm8-n1]|uniref:Uncharacterized protein n=1 Tax=Suillus luteus UH-Slu-Lm8-n1 TaxID=930992 RepID=A0A0D0A112_9AGAM|nr:hypothetical protein CY34DRAFT_17005 [Suillus luteus UH-Slu-Lm8-n1]
MIVIIGADGTSLAPAVIFKGKAYQSKWGENNLLNVLLSYFKKGWTNSKIGAE